MSNILAVGPTLAALAVHIAHFCLLLSSTAALAASSGDSSVTSRVWNVANNGVDRSNCGSLALPCRSISQALANASPGDSIVVGSGRYGDLNRDGVLGGTGEEAGGCATAAVCVDNSVRLESREGAALTVIDVTGVTEPTNGVLIAADDVVFGGSHRGFTVRGAANIGVVILGSEVSVIDNIAAGNTAEGFASGLGTSQCRLVANTAVQNRGTGFFMSGTGHNLQLNIAQANLTAGFALNGSGDRFYFNSAIGNAQGIDILTGSDHRLVRNAFIGNDSVGVNILPRITGVVLHQNNIFGNGQVALGSTLNVGVSNASRSLVSATNNFWGSSTGPGSNPADDILTNSLSRTEFIPFATQSFAIQPD